VEAPILKAVALISWSRISDGHLAELGTHNQRGDRIRYLTVATCPPFKGGEQSGVVAVTKPSVSGRRIRGSVKNSSPREPARHLAQRAAANEFSGAR